ncbi:MAG: hypothetical protein ACRCVX_02190 [Shewanella sp.]
MMEVFKDHVKLSKEEHLNNLRHASDLAEAAGSQRMMAHYAKQYLELVTTTVTSGDDDLMLAYPEQVMHLNQAKALLQKAVSIK